MLISDCWIEDLVDALPGTAASIEGGEGHVGNACTHCGQHWAHANPSTSGGGWNAAVRTHRLPRFCLQVWSYKRSEPSRGAAFWLRRTGFFVFFAPIKFLALSCCLRPPLL